VRRLRLDLPVTLLVLLGAALQKHLPFVLFALLLSVLLHRAIVLALPLLGGRRLLLQLTRPR